MSIALRLSLLVMVVLPATAFAQEALVKNLKARMIVGDFGNPRTCVLQSQNLGAAQAPDSVPGNPHFIVPAGAPGLEEMMVFRNAGFYSEGPAREFRLTPKGANALVKAEPYCFLSSTPVIQLISATPTAAPQGLANAGQAHLVKFRVRAEPAPWTQSADFVKFFGKPADAREGAVQEQVMFLANGQWVSEREVRIGMLMRTPARSSVEAQAERLAALTPASLGRVVTDKNRGHLAPCVQLPRADALTMYTFTAKETPMGFAFYDGTERRDLALHERTVDLARRLVTAGVVKAEPFEGKPFQETKAGKGTRYVLTSDAVAAIVRGNCLSLGDPKIEALWIGEPDTGQQEVRRINFGGWARLDKPRPFAAPLAAQVPAVRTLLEKGYGFSGRITGRETDALEIQAPTVELAAKP